jgi:OmpA-OmpF porin, OOP family
MNPPRALVPLALAISLILLSSLRAEEPQRPLVTKDTFIKELSEDYDPPPPGARGLEVEPPPSITVMLFFKYDCTDLADEQSLKQLQEAGAAFTSPELAPFRFHVEGHTDSDGEEDYNLNLSQRRADAIVKLLTEQYGVKPEMLEPVGKGEMEPIADNSTAEGKQQNRRVVFARK